MKRSSFWLWVAGGSLAASILLYSGTVLLFCIYYEDIAPVLKSMPFVSLLLLVAALVSAAYGFCIRLQERKPNDSPRQPKP
jgi:hypothetical protein